MKNVLSTAALVTTLALPSGTLAGGLDDPQVEPVVDPFADSDLGNTGGLGTVGIIAGAVAAAAVVALIAGSDDDDDTATTTTQEPNN